MQVKLKAIAKQTEIKKRTSSFVQLRPLSASRVITIQCSLVILQHVWSIFCIPPNYHQVCFQYEKDLFPDLSLVAFTHAF